MGEIEQLELSLTQVSDAQLIDVLVELSDELASRAARMTPDSRRYEQAGFLIDLATEELKQVREDS